MVTLNERIYSLNVRIMKVTERKL